MGHEALSAGEEEDLVPEPDGASDLEAGGGLPDRVERRLPVRVELLADGAFCSSCLLAGGQGPCPEERVPLSPGSANAREFRGLVLRFCVCCVLIQTAVV